MNPIDKQCSKCSEVKPLDSFPIDKRRPSGRMGVCKACCNAQWVPRSKRVKTPLTQQRLLDLLSYEPDSGALRWRESMRNGVASGDVAGTVDAYGYISVSVDGNPYKAHRLIWMMVHGCTPAFMDHIDHNRVNNKLENLREVSRLENQRNLSLHCESTTGVTGVHARKDRPGWFSTYIGHGKDRKYLGNFKSFEDAVSARKAAEIQMGYHENHGK